MVLKIDIANFIGVGLMAFVFIWLANRGLRAMNQSTWTTSGQ